LAGAGIRRDALHSLSRDEHSLNVANAEPGHRAALEIEPRQAHHDAARLVKRVVHPRHEGIHRLVVRLLQGGDGGACHDGRLRGVPEAVDHRDERGPRQIAY